MKGSKYTEPSGYIPKSIRKEFELGEFNKDTAKGTKKKADKKSGKKK